MSSSTASSSSRLQVDRPASGKKDRLYLLVVLCVLGSALLMGEVAVRFLVVPIPNSVPYQVHRVYTETEADVVVGDSHIYRSFLLGDEFLNLGLGGSSIPMIDVVLRRYFARRNPGRVVLQASPQMFSESRLRRAAFGYDEFFTQSSTLPLHFYLLEPGIGRALGPVKSLADVKELRRRRRAAEEVAHLVGDWHLQARDTREELTRKRVLEQVPYEQGIASAIPVYETLIEFLLERGAQVCLLRPPVDDFYLQMAESIPAFARAEGAFRAVAESAQVPYLDFRSLDYEFSADKFLNADHLTPAASVDFSRLVSQACFAGTTPRSEPGSAGWSATNAQVDHLSIGQT